MPKYLIAVDIDDDDAYLEHYGVLGMKWHHHLARSYYNKANKYAARAKKKGQDAINSDRIAIGLTKSNKLLNKANKYLNKANYHDMLNESNANKKLDKIRSSSKYNKFKKDIQSSKDMLAYAKKNKEDFYDLDEELYAKNYMKEYDNSYKKWKKSGLSDQDAKDYAQFDAEDYASNNSYRLGKTYTDYVNSYNQSIKDSQTKMNNMTDKWSKRKKKYVVYNND